MIIGHVALGALQSAAGPFMSSAVGASAALVITLHLLAARKEQLVDSEQNIMDDTGAWMDAGDPREVPDKRAKIIAIADDERVAIFRDGKKLSAISNVCAHQNGHSGKAKLSMAVSHVLGMATNTGWKMEDRRRHLQRRYLPIGSNWKTGNCG